MLLRLLSLLILYYGLLIRIQILLALDFVVHCLLNQSWLFYLFLWPINAVGARNRMCRGFMIWCKPLLVKLRKLSALNLVLSPLLLNILESSAHVIEFKVRTRVGTRVFGIIFIFKIDAFVVE